MAVGRLVDAVRTQDGGLRDDRRRVTDDWTTKSGGHAEFRRGNINAIDPDGLRRFESKGNIGHHSATAGRIGRANVSYSSYTSATAARLACLASTALA
jgi:hypothetical protein